jgi:O-antigen ligase
MIQIAIAFTGLIVMLQARNFDTGSQLKLIKIYALISVLQTLYGLISFAVYRINGSDIGGLMFGQGAESVTLKGTFKEANLYGAYVGIGLLLCLVLLVNKMVRHVKLWYLASILLFFGLMLSWTRSAWIGFAVVIVAMALYNYRAFLRRRSIACLLLTLLLIAAPAASFIQAQFDRASGESGLFFSKITNLFDTEGGTGAYRVEQFNQALVDVQGHELLGRGYFSIKVFGPDAWISNMYLFIYHDTGMIGCLLFFSILVSVILKGFASLVLTVDRQRKVMIAALLAGVFFYLFTFNFTPGHTLSMFWIHRGLLLAVAGNRGEKADGQARV